MKLFNIILETNYGDYETNYTNSDTLCCVTEDKAVEVLLSYKKRLEELAEIKFEETGTNNFEFHYEYGWDDISYNLYCEEVNTCPDVLDKEIESNFLSTRHEVIEYTYKKTKELKNKRFRSLSVEERNEIRSDRTKSKEFIDNISKEVQLEYRGFYVEPKELYKDLMKKEREENSKKGIDYDKIDVDLSFRKYEYGEHTEKNKYIKELERIYREQQNNK